MRTLLLTCCLFILGCGGDYYRAVFYRYINGPGNCYTEPYGYRAYITFNQKYTTVNNETLTNTWYDLKPDGVSHSVEAEIQEVEYAARIKYEADEHNISGTYSKGKNGVLHPFVADCFDIYSFRGIK